MSRSSSLSGLGRGRGRGRRDIAEDEHLAERRPGRFRVEDWEGELAGTQSDAESKWITMEYNAPSPYLGYNRPMDQIKQLIPHFPKIHFSKLWKYQCECFVLSHLLMTGKSHIH